MEHRYTRKQRKEHAWQCPKGMTFSWTGIYLLLLLPPLTGAEVKTNGREIRYFVMNEKRKTKERSRQGKNSG